MSTRKRTPTRRAFGTLRKLPSKRWQASYIGPDLQRHTAPVTFDAKIDGEGWLSREARKIADGNWTPPPAPAARPQARTVAAYAADWLAVRTLKPRTRSHYRWLLDTYIVPGLGELAV